MKTLILLTLICGPILAVLSFKGQSFKKDPDEVMRWKLDAWELARPDYSRKSREPKWPKGYPSDPDSGSWKGRR